MRRLLPLLVVALVASVIAFPLGVLASHRFGDVLDSNPFHADIDALADSGVTTGCGGGNFCPSANVTREQMAAFMNRLGALQQGKTPVVNADKVDGVDALDVAAGFTPIPAGTTVIGFEEWDWSTIADNQDVTLRINLPGIGPYGLADAAVNFAPDPRVIDGDSACTGSPVLPTAPPGLVCLYLNGSAAIDGAQGLSAPGWPNARQFRVRFLQNAIGSGADMWLDFAWAYTAPFTGPPD